MAPAAAKIELPGIEKFKSGKVREVYDLVDQYLPAVLYSNANFSKPTLHPTRHRSG